MGKNRLIIGVGFIGIIVLITVSIIVRIYYIDIEKKYSFIEKNIIDATKKCILEEKCSGNIVILEELYNEKYIDIQINPKTKKEFNQKSYIKTLNYEFVVIK